jgi:hypothetical protein
VRRRMLRAKVDVKITDLCFGHFSGLDCGGSQSAGLSLSILCLHFKPTADFVKQLTTACAFEMR